MEGVTHRSVFDEMADDASPIRHGSANHLVVVGMRADPEPEIAAVGVNGQRAIAQPTRTDQ